MDDRNNKAIDIYLREIGGDIMSDEQERQVAARIEKGDEKAAQELTTANLRYVVKLAGDYCGKGLSVEDLICEGNMAMTRAAKRFRPSTGKRFVVYAAPYIREAMEKAIEQQNSLYSIPKNEGGVRDSGKNRLISSDAPLNGRSNLNIKDFVADDGEKMEDDYVEEIQRVKEIEGALAMLDNRSRNVITAFYGINSPHKTMAEIAGEMGLTRERVRQIRRKAERFLFKHNRRLLDLLNN